MDFTLNISVDQTPKEAFDAITNVRGWWSKEIQGETSKLNDEFNYHYQDIHRSKIKLIEVVPNKKVVWVVLDNYFSFTEDKTEWTGDHIIFDISENKNKTDLHFTHKGLGLQQECFSACSEGWTQYITQSLKSLIATGKGQPNSKETAYTTHEVALRFNELAKEEKWFDIQDELFADDVKSIEPVGSPYFANAEGKGVVRKKGEDFVSKIEAVHSAHTTSPVVGGNHFAVGRTMDITVHGFGKIKLDQIMMYEVKDGKIVKEQFFY